MNNITISMEEYQQLYEDSLFLVCLEEAGVDNFAFYDMAREEFRKRLKEFNDD